MSGGLEKKVVKLISAEDFEFVIDYDAACVSNTIRNMLNSQGNFIESEEGEIRFPSITTPVLEVVCKYFYYKLRYANTASESIPEFKVAPEMALELLMAANYLDT
ncbi:hypothetical protein D9Q98_002320 [Chlorella vulgaris]|uniref:Elongin-C n=1 Tax=Chlorella vulgaris TaxID=3077 RepID=A0A9D4TXD1_CHLVU|nr:hypothetical protein D9Q98_002320 [Chlorella vulgaris]